MDRSKPYLALCSMYRDHAEYLQEWIEFHRLVGVERFFLYDNESTDDHERVLAPYVERGIVTVHPWQRPESVERGVPWGLIYAFDDCLARHRDDSRWIAFIDIDEFLFSPTGRMLPDVLGEFESAPGVVVSQLNYGSSGHVRKPPGLVIESYVHRRSYPPDERTFVKSIVDPARTAKCFNAHGFFYEEGATAVDENHEPFPSPPRKKPVSASLLRLNHYVVKSREEYAQKRALWTSAGRPWPDPDLDWIDREHAERDELILRWVPALHEALEAPVA